MSCFPTWKQEWTNGKVALFLGIETPEDLRRASMSVKSNAVGLDDISLRYLKVVYPLIEEQVLHLMNFVFLTGIFPSQWKVSRVVPIPKKTVTLTVSDFRPISVLPVLSKVFETLAKKQMLDWVARFELLSPFQSGYSITTAVLKIADDIVGALDGGQVSALVLLDFSKAFDCLDHRLLCRKLSRQFGFGPSSVGLVRSYLANWRQVVFVDGVASRDVFVHCGVPQGSILGPLLFSIFVNDLGEVVEYSGYHLYADDLQLYHSSPAGDITRLSAELNRDLSSVFAWSRRNGLLLSVGKTQALFVSRPRSLDEPRHFCWMEVPFRLVLR
jgi:hypothetical protein